MSILNSKITEVSEIKFKTIDISTKSYKQSENLRKSKFLRFITLFFRPSFSQAIIVITDQGFCSIANFLTGVLVARACSKEEYGVFVIGLTILYLMTGLQNSLISGPYTILYPRCEVDERCKYLGSTLIHQIFLLILTAIAFIIGSLICFFIKANPVLTSNLFMLSLASFAVMIREFVRLTMLAELKVWLNLAMSLVINISTVTAMLIVYKTKILTLSNAYLIMTCCSGIPALYITGIYVKKMVLIKSRIWNDFKLNFKLGKWLVGRTFAYMGSNQVYPVALAAFHGTATVALYGACLQLANLLNPLCTGMNIFLMPKLSHLSVHDPQKTDKLVLYVMVWLALMLAMLFLVMLFIGNWAVTKLYGQNYMDLNPVLLMCILAISASVLSSPISIAIDARKGTLITFKGRVFGAILSLTIGLVCVIFRGPVGAALGLFISHVLTGLYWLYKANTFRYERLAIENY
ncbi:MAG: lipopolysaccharide biosynthesis protein [Sedimentisphaerales bacterium]|nr:lipopolysaccharide biosynthesis protein [Sedimentisphaerales bacterium]